MWTKIDWNKYYQDWKQEYDWEDFSMSSPKYKAGDKVRKKGAVVEQDAEIEEYVGTGINGVHEYCIKFKNTGAYHYCSEPEIEKIRLYDPNVKCECGAEVVYGRQCSRLHHALWCPKRGDVDENDN